MSPSTNPLAALYRACGTIGNLGTPSAPIAHYALLVNPTHRSVTGVVHITQAIQGPDSDISINVTGTIHELVFGAQVTHVVLLSGNYMQPCPPPETCILSLKFAAHMAIDEAWNGVGGFSYGRNERIDNVPVKSSPC
jgi:hypothetical protein